jgi:hypothetical protein
MAIRRNRRRRAVPRPLGAPKQPVSVQIYIEAPKGPREGGAAALLVKGLAAAATLATALVTANSLLSK